MPKYIARIYSEHLRSIELGERVFSQTASGDVKEIEFNSGVSSEIDTYKESYTVSFVNSDETLEVFDVIYVIRKDYK